MKTNYIVTAIVLVMFATGACAPTKSKTNAQQSTSQSSTQGEESSEENTYDPGLIVADPGNPGTSPGLVSPNDPVPVGPISPVKNPGAGPDIVIDDPVPVGPIGPIEGSPAATQAFIEKLYFKLLHQPVDKDGLAFWMSKAQSGSVTCDAMVFIFLHQGAAQVSLNKAINGDLGAKIQYMRQFLFYGVLDRAADSAGQQYWAKLLMHGYSLEKIIDHFLESDEFLKRCSAAGIQI